MDQSHENTASKNDLPHGKVESIQGGGRPATIWFQNIKDRPDRDEHGSCEPTAWLIRKDGVVKSLTKGRQKETLYISLTLLAAVPESVAVQSAEASGVGLQQLIKTTSKLRQVHSP